MATTEEHLRAALAAAEAQLNENRQATEAAMAEAATARALAENLAKQLNEFVTRGGAATFNIGSPQAAPQGTAARENTELDRPRQTIDTKLVTQISVFDGTDDKWCDWSFSFQAICGLIGLDETMEKLLTASEEVLGPRLLTEEEVPKSKALYFFLVTRTAGKGLAVVRSTPKGAGLTAWKRL